MIEHIDDDYGALVNLRESLKSNSRLFLTVPAMHVLWSKQDEKLMHQRRYTKKELEEVLKRTGLRVCYISYYNFFLFLPIFFVRQIEKIIPLNRNNKSDEDINNWLLNALFYQVFSCEKKHILKGSKYPFGVSLIVIAESKENL